MEMALTFDDVALVPQYNNVPSRTEPNLGSWLTSHSKVQIPLIPSNMDTVIGHDMAKLLIERGTFPIFHRFTTHEEQMAWVKKYEANTYVSAGMRDIDKCRELLDLGARGVCIDVAHGHSEMMVHFIEKLRQSHPDQDIIAGNVCTAMAYHDLVSAGASAVKVGIGPGAACTTRMVTGFGVPQFSAIRECARIADKLRVPLIADGGIRTSRDVVLALAAGASTVMMGKLFALTNESPAQKRENKEIPSGYEAKYRGQASEDFQVEFYGNLRDKTVAEGIDFWAPVSGPAGNVINKILGGLRSGLTYGGARSIKELQRKAEFVRVAPAYMGESLTRAF